MVFGINKINTKYLFLYISWFFILFASFEGFGLRKDSWGGLGSSSMGFFGLIQLVVLLVSIIFPFFIKIKHYFRKDTELGTPIKLFYLLIVVVLIQSLLMAFFNVLTFSDLFSNMIKLKYLYMYFLFVYLLTRENGVKIAINSLLFCAILSVLAVFVVYLTGYQSNVIKISLSSMIGREFRIILPTAMLITFGYFYSISIYKIKKNIVFLVLALFCFVGTIFQMHRGVLLGITFVSLFAFYKVYGIKLSNIIYIILLLFVLFLGVAFTFNQIGYSSEKLLTTIFDTQKEVSSGSGNFGIRVFLPLTSFKYVISNYYILGVGLKWETLDSFKAYLNLRYYATPTLDSGYNNIIVIFGLVGIIVFIYLFTKLFVAIIKIIKKNNKEFKHLAYSLLFMFMYILMSGFTSDSFILQNSAVIFILLLSFLYVCELKVIDN